MIQILNNFNDIDFKYNKYLTLLLNNNPCVYLITCNNKSYIGSTKCIINRTRQHLHGLTRNIHANQYLQHSFNKYGQNTFKISILEFVENINDLLIREQYYLDIYKPEFNISKSSTAPMMGRKHSEKTIKKMLGKIPWNYGVPRTEEEKKLISLRKTEEYKNKSEDWYKKMSEIRKKTNPKYWLGKKVPDHVVQNLIKYGKSISQKIECIETGEIFTSQILCAKSKNIRQGHISEVLNGTRKTAGGFTFRRITCE